MKRKRVVYEPLKDGEWIAPKRNLWREQCCDCGLIHYWSFKTVKGQIQFKTVRNDRATAAARKRFKFTKDD